MNKLKSNQAGIGHVVAILVLVFVGIVGFAGYQVMSNNNVKQANSDGAVILEPKVPEKISTADDLDATKVALDDLDGQLDSNLNDSALDADLNQML